MHLSKVNEALNHKIVGGSEYQWHCYENARYLDFESDYAHASVIFNMETQEVYVAEINDKEDKHKPYRWLNPLYSQNYFTEAKERNVDPNLAWDNVNWYDLETTEDWLTKANAIFNGQDFDPRVSVPLDLDNESLLRLCMLAHERDITLNKMVEIVLQAVIDKHKENM